MRIFVSHSYSAGHEIGVELTHALTDAGHEVFDPASTAASFKPVMESISNAIRRSDVVIALLTERNLSVYYEIGLATGANVPTLIAACNPEDIVSDLASAPYVQLTNDVDVDVAGIIRRVIEVAEVRPRIDPVGRESAEALLVEAARDPSVLESVSASEFGQLVANLFHERGFLIRTTSASTARGFDFVIDGELDGVSPTIVEVKHHSRRGLVSVGTVRQLLGSMTAAGAGRAILVSSSGFTASARAAATEWPIELMTADDLLRLSGPGTRSPIDPSTP